MRFHALQGMDEERSPFEIYLPVFGCNVSLYSTSRPERVSHRAPGLSQIGPIQTFAVFADLETWSSSSDLEVDKKSLVPGRFDCIVSSIFTEIEGDPVTEEAGFAVIETVSLDRV